MRKEIAIIDEAAHISQKKWNASLVLFPVCGKQRFEMGRGSANFGAFKALLLAVLECPVSKTFPCGGFLWVSGERNSRN